MRRTCGESSAGSFAHTSRSARYPRRKIFATKSAPRSSRTSSRSDSAPCTGSSATTAYRSPSTAGSRISGSPGSAPSRRVSDAPRGPGTRASRRVVPASRCVSRGGVPPEPGPYWSTGRPV
ncbi:hypothetical protein LUX57_19145 [Actinomadura madurae]|uniref:hypothetical protein n=1 Tax=Actinomadura madurae TaxID=1993 RepID=UPI0020D1FCE2|nr:hypothetical protein [Actinomadura madurae]MCP9966976.1 hypothetical protein [Actinomadura madurae]